MTIHAVLLILLVQSTPPSDAARVAPAPAATQERSAADVRWLRTWRDAAFDALLPVTRRSGETVAYRRYRDLDRGERELSFSIELAPHRAGHAVAATLTEAAGASIQEQLLRLHAAEPEAPLQALLPRVTLRRIRVGERPCRALDARLRDMPRVLPATLASPGAVRHPIVQRVVLRTTRVEADVSVFDAGAPITDWAQRTVAAIRTCAAAASR